MDPEPKPLSSNTLLNHSQGFCGPSHIDIATPHVLFAHLTLSSSLTFVLHHSKPHCKLHSHTHCKDLKQVSPKVCPKAIPQWIPNWGFKLAPKCALKGGPGGSKGDVWGARPIERSFNRDFHFGVELVYTESWCVPGPVRLFGPNSWCIRGPVLFFWPGVYTNFWGPLGQKFQ